CVYDLARFIENEEIRNIFLLEIKCLLVRLQFTFIKEHIWQQLRIDVLDGLSFCSACGGGIHASKHRYEVNIHVIAEACQNTAGLLNEFLEYRLKPRVKLIFRFFGIRKSDERVLAFN